RSCEFIANCYKTEIIPNNLHSEVISSNDDFYVRISIPQLVNPEILTILCNNMMKWNYMSLSKINYKLKFLNKLLTDCGFIEQLIIWETYTSEIRCKILLMDLHILNN